jgi:hypothetical protein
MSFGGVECFLLFVVVGARNQLGSTLLTLVLTSLKANIQFVCGLGCTLIQDEKSNRQPPILAWRSLW